MCLGCRGCQHVRMYGCTILQHMWLRSTGKGPRGSGPRIHENEIRLLLLCERLAAALVTDGVIALRQASDGVYHKMGRKIEHGKRDR